MKLPLLTLVLALTGLLIALTVLGFFFPGSLNWGFHFLGFLPAPVFLLYLLFAGLLLIFWYRGDLQRGIERAATTMEKQPVKFLLWLSGIFVLTAMVFRVRASVLGDSFNLLKNFVEYGTGAVPYLDPWNEPLSMHVVYRFVTFLGPLQVPQIFTSFVIMDLVFGLGFLVTIFFIARNLFDSPVERFLTFVLCLALPYMLFFFGYIEVYAVPALLLALFVLVSLLVIRKKLPFAVLPAVWLLLALSHAINGLLLLSVLYLAVIEYKEKRYRELAVGFGGAALLGLITLALAQFDTQRLILQDPISHFLSVTNNISELNAYSQAYTLFSPYHFLDLLNYIVLMSPFAVVLVIVLSVRQKKNDNPNAIRNWFIIAIVPLAVYLFLAKLEQGTASDWDAFAAQFLLLNLLMLVLLFREDGIDRVKIAALVVGVTLLQSLPWFAVNAPVQASIARFQSLWDPRILSHMGNYTHALRLMRYDLATDDSLATIDVWDRYRALYPNDPRGYANEIEALSAFTPNDFTRKIQTYDGWLRVAPADSVVRSSFASVCINAGNQRFAAGKLEQARAYYARALSLDSTLSRAHNNLGSVLAQQGNPSAAVGYFQRAVRLDSTYADAWFNLGMAHIDKGDAQKGRSFIQRAAALGNAQAKEFLNKKQ